MTQTPHTPLSSFLHRMGYYVYEALPCFGCVNPRLFEPGWVMRLPLAIPTDLAAIYRLLEKAPPYSAILLSCSAICVGRAQVVDAFGGFCPWGCEVKWLASRQHILVLLNRICFSLAYADYCSQVVKELKFWDILMGTEWLKTRNRLLRTHYHENMLSQFH